MSEADKYNLKPCPFCGGDAYYCETSNSDMECISSIQCCNCSAIFEVGPAVPDGIIERWNSRPREDKLNARIEELEAFVRKVAKMNLYEWDNELVEYLPSDLPNKARALLRGEEGK